MAHSVEKWNKYCRVKKTKKIPKQTVMDGGEISLRSANKKKRSNENQK